MWLEKKFPKQHLKEFPKKAKIFSEGVKFFFIESPASISRPFGAKLGCLILDQKRSPEPDLIEEKKFSLNFAENMLRKKFKSTRFLVKWRRGAA